MFKFILSTESSAIRDELLKYFDYNLNTLSNSSFNQRRSQILPEAFEYLFYEFNQRFAMLHLFRGLHLIACDGSDLNISHNIEDVDTHFPHGLDNKGFNQLHLNAF